ncbi:uncharacterized protein LOC142772184 [Rhipicephalus microplus]|uniref:uncharacterized protein LOC142772184 n=1 Tax=Rhipicephalus microplus TaxID=6941 RepID=UPI003F6CED26
MEGKQPDEEKNDPSKKEEEDPKKSRTRLNAGQRHTPLTKKQVRGLLGIVFFRQPLEPPGWPISPNRPPLPPRPCGLHALPPIGWARSRGMPRRPGRAAAPRYHCRSPRSLSPRAQHRLDVLPTVNSGLVWPRSQRDCYRCRRSVTSWTSRGTSTEAVSATRTVGTTMEPEIFAGTDGVGHESLVLDHSGFWIRPPFAMPPAVVGAPQVLQTAAATAGATIEGIGVPEPECEGSQRSRTDPLSRPSPQRCQERESRKSRRGSTGSWQRSVGSIRSNQEGHNLNDAVGGQFHGLCALSEDDQNHRIL